MQTKIVEISAKAKSAALRPRTAEAVAAIGWRYKFTSGPIAPLVMSTSTPVSKPLMPNASLGKIRQAMASTTHGPVPDEGACSR